MTEGPLERIVRESGVDDIVEVLSERLSPTDLQSLLLEVARRRAARISPSDLLERYQRDRFVRPAAVDAAALSAFELLAWSLLPDGFEAIEPSPLCPLGTSSIVGTVNQNKVVSTVRTAEVVADTTNVLALECALRRRTLLADRTRRLERVCLAASQRQVRAQGLAAGQRAHFRLVGLCVAGRDRGQFAFETESLVELIGYLVTVVGRAQPDWRVEVGITDLGDRSGLLEREVLHPLSERFPGARLRMDPDRASGRGYYVDACFKLWAGRDGEPALELGDGGCTTWTRQLLSNEKERLVIAGLGVERLLGVRI